VARAAILNAAAKLYADYGYEATTIRDIASARGLLPGSIYHYFRSKDQLIIEVFTEGIKHILTAVCDATKDIDDPWERLEVACAAHLETLTTGSSLARVLSKDIPVTSPEVKDAIVALRDQYESVFAKYVAALGFATPLEARIFRLQLLGSLNSTTKWYRKSSKLKPADIARQFLSNMKRP